MHTESCVTKEDTSKIERKNLSCGSLTYLVVAQGAGQLRRSLKDDGDGDYNDLLRVSSYKSDERKA